MYPERRNLTHDFPKLFTETKGSDALEFFYHLSRSLVVPEAHKHMNVIWLDS
jgi:hypothetical protein